MLVAPLQWIAAAMILASGVVTVRVDRFSLDVVGLLLLVWAAHTARTACSGRWARARWVAVSAVSVAAAILSFAPPQNAAWGTLTEIADVALFVTLVGALAGMTAEYAMSTARRWRTLSLLAWPAAASFAAVSIVTWRVGVPMAETAEGAWTEIGGARLALPPWAWIVMIGGSVPLLAVGGFAIFAFVRTYREANAPFDPNSEASDVYSHRA